MIAEIHITYTMVLQLLGAILLTLPTAYNRERNSRIMGLRTFPLVALGACAYVIIGRSLLDDSDALARIMQGLMTGIGFVGGGAILKHDDHVKGTASAASIWITGAVGAAVGFEQWGLAITLSAFNFLTIWTMGFLKTEIRETDEESRSADS